MDDTETEEKASPSLTVDDALKMFEEYKSYWSDIYSEANIDLKMATGDAATHWGEAYSQRLEAKKLTLVINELPQFIHQVTNDIRQNVPSIKVLPISDGDIETGKIYSGLFRAIEDHSHADEVCDTAAEYAVKCSIGFMRLDHDYCSDESDEQEIIFKTVFDPLSNWLDPASVEYDGRDAMGSISLETINKKDFDRLYPGKNFVSFADPKAKNVGDTIVIGEVFVKVLTGERGKKATIYRYKFSGDDMLAKTTFPGKYIPLVPVYGEVTWIDGKRNIASLIRQARDPQLRLNHWACKEQELLNMAPVAPVMAVEGTLVNERRQWQSPGTETVLEYRLKDLDGNDAPQPSRLQPPQVPTGIINAMEGAKQNIKETLGMYNASIGEKSNEVSGVAIDARKTEGDVATFHFPDNVRRSYGHMGEIAIEMMPVIYDTPRIIQTLNEEQDVQMVGINGAQMQDGQKQAYDLTKGKYRVRITTGASYTTKRQEEAAFLSAVFQKDPALMQIGGDILFKSLDSPGAQALGERLHKTISPQLLEDGQQDNPQMMQMQQALQQAQAQIQQLGAELQSKQGDQQIKQGEIAIKQQELKIKEAELQLKAEQLNQPPSDALDVDKQAFDQSIQKRELALKEAEFQLKVTQARQSQMASQDSTEEPNNEDNMPMTEEQLVAQLDSLRAQKALAEQQQMALQQSQEQEQQEREMKMQQANAILHTLSVIAQQLQGLTVQVSQPKRVIRDESGAIVGVQ